MKNYILSIDQGTTSTRAIIFDKNANMVGSSSRPVELLYPHRGWVEVDALAIWVSVIEVYNEVLVKTNISPRAIDSVGITNQRETTVIWNKETGLPIYNAIVWQSKQTTDICEQYKEHSKLIQDRTGLLINPYFSASKIKFILDNVKGARELANQGKLLFGTIDTWILYRLSEGRKHLTDITNASRTMLFNIHTFSWDEELCKLFDIPMNILPEVKPNAYDFGEATFLKEKLHIHAMAGDQQSALFGQNCFKPGEVKNTYGTGCFMLMNIGDKPVKSQNGLLTTIGWQINNKVTYALEGSVFIGGAIVQWLRDNLQIIKEAGESEEFALKASKTEDIYFVPAFVGLGTPYWDDEARGTIFGLTRNSDKYSIAKAALESIAFQCRDVFEVMKNETGLELSSLKVDGGTTANNYLMQFQSDIISTVIELPHCLETTALGVAYMAGLNSGFYKSLEDIVKVHTCVKSFKPQMSEMEKENKYANWKKAVEATRKFK